MEHSMEQSLGGLAILALGAMPAAQGDNVDRDGGQSYPRSVTRAPTFEHSEIQVHREGGAEHHTGANQIAVTGPAYSGPPGMAFSANLSLVPPVPVELEFEDGPQEMVHLPRLLANSGDSPELLEDAVRAGMELIHKLVVCLEPHAVIPDAGSFLGSLKGLKERSTTPRTVVGVVGNTGAGKSSVINALLDEEELVATSSTLLACSASGLLRADLASAYRLLPTNCVRACTASPTEVSYNYSQDPAALYWAEVEFISREDWIGELGVLFAELLDGQGEVSRECTNADSDAGMAYSKLKAVYPSKTREMLASAIPHELADERAVNAVLGTVTRLQAQSAPELYRGLQQYVDSKEKATAAARSNTMEYWPLVKVVRIYTKADALSTGAVIVDLPGVHDSNAARAAVATNYMKACSGLWIVAPITRAVDDKTAKTLMGDSFKRQLKYDGTYSAVSFICSKTDDLVVKEAARNLGMGEVVSELCSRADSLTKGEESLTVQLATFERMKSSNASALDECEASIDTWEDFQIGSREAEIVSSPSQPGKRKSRVFHDGTEMPVANHDGGSFEGSGSFEDRMPLTNDAISHTLVFLRKKRKDIRADQRDVERYMADLRHEVGEIRQKRESLLAEAKAACIKGRNDYSREAIKQDFAMGIRELDQENAAEEDDVAFNPDQALRDYEEVARSLPVFCVSSRAFQNLSGRLDQGDFDGHGFRTAEDTEIPQLQEHAKMLTHSSRIKTCRRFLNDLMQLLNSMNYWAFHNGIMYTLPATDKRVEEYHLRMILSSLQKDFNEAVENSISSIRQCLTESIHNTFNDAIPTAIDSAVGTCDGWGAPKANGGLCWSTYMATVRRNGAYKGSAGDRDFNSELFEPISRNLATGWERAFQRRLPAILSEWANTSQGQLQCFHQVAMKRAEERFANVGRPFLLISQIGTHQRTLEDLPNHIAVIVTELQREANRESVPVIRDVMASTYEQCAAERGIGAFARMKSMMLNHVDTSRNTMFSQAAAAIRQSLEALCNTVKRSLNDTTKEIMRSMFCDYLTELMGTGPRRPGNVSPHELQLRVTVRGILREADNAFNLLPTRGDVSDASDEATSEEKPSEPTYYILPATPQTLRQQSNSSLTTAQRLGTGGLTTSIMR